MPNLKEISKSNYLINGADPSESEIQIGCLQRVADATEKMAEGFQAILYTLKKAEADRDAYQRWYHEQASLVKQRDNTIRTLKGHITRKEKALTKIIGEYNFLAVKTSHLERMAKEKRDNEQT